MTIPSKREKFAIVYLAYGLETTKYQAVLSIYTLYHHLGEENKDFLFFIYTDSRSDIFDKYLSNIPVSIEVITKNQIKVFKGADDYVFRVKPCVIKDYFAKNNYPMLYMDTDTFFLRNPMALFEKIQQGSTIMNTPEHDFIDGGEKEYLHWFNLRQALKQQTYNVQGVEVKIPLSTMMWNAGIIGISHEDSHLVNDIIALTDNIYSKYKTFIVEQFAASYILQKYSTVFSTEDYIHHYWLKGVKNSFNARLPGFLEKHKGVSGQDLYRLAFDFAKEVSNISTNYKEPILDRIVARFRLVAKVIRKGHV